MTRVKICCIRSVDEARLAIRRGAAAIGLVSAMPSGPGVIDEALIAEIAAAVPPAVRTFLLTSRVDAEAIIDQHERCRPTTLQLCDRLPVGELARLRAALPGVALVPVIHVTGDASREEAREVVPFADLLLLDSGNPALVVKELGGTGRVHDWSVSARIVAESRVPVFLAGGLSPDNVGAAIRAVRPYGVDLCSSVRTADALDEGKLARFMQAVAAG
jgi:phosphoribosylanthranilate isomerase